MGVRRVNTKNKRVQASMAAGGGPSPLAVSGTWATKRVPLAWKRQLPGTPYPCKSAPVGEEVTLRGDTDPSVVVGCATPLGPSLLQFGRVSSRYEHEGSLMVRTPIGAEVPVHRSVVRERMRREREAGRATCYCTGLPHPHRIASSPLCVHHDASAERLAERARDAYEEGDDDRAAQFSRMVAELEARQAESWMAAEKRRATPRTEYKARIARAKREMRAEGWDL